MKPNPRLRPQNAPFYGPQTSQVIAGFRRRDGFELDGKPDADHVADLAVRRKPD
jgi:peptidoglycan hydrolase-like protein with peptidoglycan-binding domain